MNDLKLRIYEVSKDLQLVNFATVTERGAPWVRYVMGKADGDLIFRFCTRIDSRKVDQIRRNPEVHISLGISSLETAKNWIQVQGTAKVSTDSIECAAFWFDELKNYFNGPDDPMYCIVIVTPTRIEFGTMGISTPEVWEPGT